MPKEFIPTNNYRWVDLWLLVGIISLELTITEVFISSAELMKLLVKDGWVLKRIKGSHHIFKKDGIPDQITVPHPEKDLANGTLRKILKQMKQMKQAK